jgi:uncharacterized protein YecE (DUF72 family)
MSASTPSGRFYLGTAGWSIPARSAPSFAVAGSHLQRYAERLPAVEINSSFYRLHRRETYERWAATVPAPFRFSVKIPKEITHELALRKAAQPLAEFLETATGLGEKLGCLLIQLPPSLAYDRRTANAFFTQLRKQYAGPAVCEPRHATWFKTDVDELLRSLHIERVLADPPPVPDIHSFAPGTYLRYYRLHGSPQIYYSEYSSEFLANLAAEVDEALCQGTHVWCIFDNTALGWALENALQLLTLQRRHFHP